MKLSYFLPANLITGWLKIFCMIKLNSGPNNKLSMAVGVELAESSMKLWVSQLKLSFDLKKIRGSKPFLALTTKK